MCDDNALCVFIVQPLSLSTSHFKLHLIKNFLKNFKYHENRQLDGERQEGDAVEAPS